MPIQLLLRPRPQCIPLLDILAGLCPLPLDAHRPIKGASLNPLGGRRGPELVVRSLLDGGHQGPPGQVDGALDDGVETVLPRAQETGLHHSRVHRDDLEVRVLLGQRPGIVYVGELAVGVARLRARLGHGGLEPVGGAQEAALGGPLQRRGQEDDADVAAAGQGGRALEAGEQQLRQERRADVVGAELDLVAVGGQALGHVHDAGVVDEDVEAVGRREQGARRRLDARKRGQVQLQVRDGRRGRGRRRRPDGFDRLLRLGPRPRPHVDVRRVVLRKLADALEAEACVAARHEDDLAPEIRHVLLRSNLTPQKVIVAILGRFDRVFCCFLYLGNNKKIVLEVGFRSC